MLIKRKNCQLLIVDIQEKFVPAMYDVERMISNSVSLMVAASKLNIPMTLSEQYPQGLGPTVDKISKHMDMEHCYAKLHFSCARNEEISNRLNSVQKNQVVICGIESHICVLQTALELKENGFDVFVVSDACTSRKGDNAELAYGA